MICSVDSTTDSMYQRVMFVFYASVLLVQLSQHRVTQSNTCFVKILQSSDNHKNHKSFVIAFSGLVISINCALIHESEKYLQILRWSLSRAFISSSQSNIGIIQCLSKYRNSGSYSIACLIIFDHISGSRN